jgi:hypothetical protein
MMGRFSVPQRLRSRMLPVRMATLDQRWVRKSHAAINTAARKVTAIERLGIAIKRVLAPEARRWAVG